MLFAGEENSHTSAVASFALVSLCGCPQSELMRSMPVVKACDLPKLESPPIVLAPNAVGFFFAPFIARWLCPSWLWLKIDCLKGDS